MPYLTKLSFVKEQTRTPKNPIKARQQKLIERLTEQIEMVQAMIDKKPFVRYHTIWVTDEETGEQVKKQLPRKVRQWYWENDGIWYFQCNYGNKKLSLKNGMNTVKVGKLDKLVPSIELLISAVEVGEMDKVLTDAYARKIV